MDKSMILRPRLSEKTYGLSMSGNVYTIEVPASANKHAVARAVQAQFGVTPTTVNIANIKGKAKRTIYKGARPVAGRRSDVKKAYITLKTGDSLPFFQTEDDKKGKKKNDKPAKKEKK
jgi:ribosomal protein L23